MNDDNDDDDDDDIKGVRKDKLYWVAVFFSCRTTARVFR